MKLFKKQFLTISFLLITLAGCSGTDLINIQTGNTFAQTKWESDKLEFSLPFYWHDGHIIINASVNGRNNLRMAFDSAASATVLFETSRTSGMGLDKSMTLDIEGSEVEIVGGVSIRVGGIHISDMSLVHVPIEQSPLFRTLDEAYFDGAIGYDLLSRFSIKINYALKTLTFYKNESFNLNPSEWKILPIEITGGIPYIKAQMQNDDGTLNTFDYVIDTGAPDYLYINSDLAKGFDFPSDFFETSTKNFDGNHILKTSRITKFIFADIQFDQLSTHDLPYFTDDIGVGLIGSGFLRKFDVVFNYKNKEMAVKKNDLFNHVSHVDRSGIQLEPHKRGGVVLSVAKESDAFVKGIRSGDIIFRINKNPLNDENFDELRNAFSSEKNSVSICWNSPDGNDCNDVLLGTRIKG